MPFQSEKQRRYMHANLPRIAKRWERDYANGGIASQGGMKNYLGEQPMVNAPQNWRSGPDSPPTELAYITDAEKDLILRSNIHGSLQNGPNEGPSGIMSLDGWGDKEQGFGMSDAGRGITGTGGHSFGDQERSVTTTVGSPRGPQTVTQTVSPKDTFKQSWSGPKGWFGGGGYRNLNVAGDTSQGHQSRFGLGSLLRGAASMFGGWPGKIGSMLSRIDPRQLRGKNPDGSWRTQQQYEDARTGRRNTKRMDYLSDRKSRGLGYGKKAYGDLLGQGYSDPFQDAINRDLQINPETTQFARSHLQSLADKKGLTNQLSAKDFINVDQSISASGHKPRSFMENLQSKYPGARPAAALSKEKILGTDWANTEIQWEDIKPGRVIGSQKVFDRLKADPTINTWGDLYQAGLSGQVEDIGGAQIMTRNPEGLAALGKEMPYGMELGKQGSWGDLEVEDLYERIPGAGASKYHVNVPLIGEEKTRGTFGLTGRGKGDFLQKDVEEKLRAAGWLSQGGRVGYKTGGIAGLWPR